MIPFRPLTIGNLFDGTFAAIRANPRVMFAISLGTMLIIGAVGGLISALVPEPNFADYFGPEGSDFLNQVVPAWPITSSAFEALFAIVSAAATLLVTGMLVLSVTNSVVGVNLDLSATWAELKPHIWRLVGTALLVWVILGAVGVAAVLVALVLTAGVALGTSSNPNEATILLAVFLLLAGVAVTIWLGVRLYFATVVVVVEGASPGAAINRSWALTKGAFWRVFGRLILMSIIVGIVAGLLGGIISAALMFLGSFLPWGLTSFFLALISSLVTGLTIPFSAAYVSEMYVDERFRKENLAPTLQQAFEQNAG